jgi:hypothetical protein
MEKSTPQAPEAAEGAPEPMEEVAEEAAAATGGEEATVPPEVALEVAIRSPEIQDAEPIRTAMMTETTASSRGGVELQARGDDLVRKNKSLRNKNKGMPLDLLGSCWRSRGSLTRCALLYLRSLRAKWSS